MQTVTKTTRRSRYFIVFPFGKNSNTTVWVEQERDSLSWKYKSPKVGWTLRGTSTPNEILPLFQRALDKATRVFNYWEEERKQTELVKETCKH